MSKQAAASLPRKPRKALSQAGVVDSIRQGILRGDVVPGQRLVEAELCSLLKTSRGNVRAALIELEHEGLVERIANRGARVRVVSIEEALQIAEVRLAVESVCVARAAERITDKEIKVMRNSAARLKELAKQSDVVGFAKLMHETFEMYVRIADKPVAAEMLERLRARNSRHQYRLTYRPGRAQIALPYRLELLDAICNRDPEAAKLALQRHDKNIQEAMKALAEERTTLGLTPSLAVV